MSEMVKDPDGPTSNLERILRVRYSAELDEIIQDGFLLDEAGAQEEYMLNEIADMDASLSDF